ncbi:MAG: ABC transporter permease [Prevotella sp.]|nr:ABC transporter permease [Prevotella sp.]
MNFPLFIAKRIYTDNKEKRQVSKPVIRIATAGVAIGLAVMIISVCVVLGFKHTIRDKVVGFGSHIQVADFLTLQSSEQYPIQMDDSMMNVLKKIEGVKHVQRYAYKQGILKTDNDFLGVLFKGVGPEFDSTFIYQNMIEGSLPHFSDESSSNKLVISKTIANQLKLKINQKIFGYFIDHQGVRARRYTIAGIYQTNLSQYDKVICMTDLYSVVKLNGWETDQASGAELTVHDFNHVNEVEDQVINQVNRTVDKYGETYSSQTIKELNPAIFSWLDLLDLNVWIILALMTAVAGVTMISGLLIIILERTNMIGVLKAMGARNKTIRRTFLWFAIFIIGRGLLWGNILGIGLLLIQKYTSLVKLDPATYYVSTVPIEFNIPFIILINIATMLICVLVLIAPSYLISHIHPVKAIRYE